MHSRIAVIGNAGGGKTTLSRSLGLFYDVPVFHVDSIQYRNNWTYIPKTECDAILNEMAEREKWLIDGFGSKPVIQRRLELADTVVFVDFRLLRHYHWAMKRLVRSRTRPRTELPEGCSEFNIQYARKLMVMMWQVHRDYTPWFRDLVSGLPPSTVVYHIRSPRELDRLVLKHQTNAR